MVTAHFGIIPGVRLGTPRIFTDSTTGEVLAPKVQPGPHQPGVLALSMGLMFCPFSCYPSRSQVPIVQLGTLEPWG